MAWRVAAWNSSTVRTVQARGMPAARARPSQSVLLLVASRAPRASHGARDAFQVRPGARGRGESSDGKQALIVKNDVDQILDNESLLSVGGFPTATSTGTDLEGI